MKKPGQQDNGSANLRRAAIFTYHRLAAPGGARSRFDFSSDVFSAHLDILAASGTRCVLPEDLSATAGAAPGGKAAMITFDDGYESDYHTALPLLEEHGFRGVTFITASLVGKPGYLTWDKVRALAEAGFSVQSHSFNHKFLTTLTPAELLNELRRSKQTIEDRTGGKVEYIAAPGGRVSPEVVKAAAEAGYSGIFNSKPGYAVSRECGISVFNRFVLKNTISIPEFSRIAGHSPVALVKASVVYETKRLLRKALGKA